MSVRLRKKNGNRAGKIRRRVIRCPTRRWWRIASRAFRADGWSWLKSGDPKTFNPITANEHSSEDICRFLFASLAWLRSGHRNRSNRDWRNRGRISPDGKTWTFKLRKNLRWSDGEPLTADDVVFTWNDVIYNPDIDNVMRDRFIIDGKKFIVTKVDDLTVQVVTPEIYAPFLENFGAGVPIMPKHILAKTVADKTFTSAYGVNWKPEDIVGSGPFRLKEYKTGAIHPAGAQSVFF